MLREANGELEREISRLKEEIAKAGDGLLADVMQKGMQAVRKSEMIGAAGQAYDASRYGSVCEAMDSLEASCMAGGWEREDGGREEL